MHKTQENEIGALLSKMRQKQNSIKKSLDNDILKYGRKTPIPITPLTPAYNSTSSSSSSSFENRLQRIRDIRERFENQYSILRKSTDSKNNTSHKLTKTKNENKKKKQKTTWQ
eukprot:210157_1